MDYKDNEKADSSLHLDDIDEFFVKNFNVLLDNKKVKEKDDIEILEDIKENIECHNEPLNTENEKSNIEILDFNLNVDKVEKLDIENISKVEKLDIENISKAEVLEDFMYPNVEVLDNLEKSNQNVEVLDDLDDNSKIEILDDEFLLDNKDINIDDKNANINLPYNIVEKEEINVLNDHDLDNYNNVTYYKQNTKKIQKNKKIVWIVLFIVILICLLFAMIKIVR